MATGGFEEQAMQQLFQQFALLSEAFPNDLLKLAARLKSEKARTELMANLWDEQGQGDPANGHRAMLKRFLDAFIPKTQCGAEPSATWETRFFLNGTNGLYANGTVAEALGALFFVEMVTPWEFTQVANWLRQNTTLSGSELQFWNDHIEHDGLHALNLLEASADEALPLPEVLAGISQAKALEDIFWGQFRRHVV